MKKRLVLAFVLGALISIYYATPVFADVDYCNVSGGTNGTSTTHEYCAGSLYRKYTDVKTKCKDSYDATGCKDVIMSHLQCPGMPDTACSATKSGYAETVRGIIKDNNVHPCNYGESNADKYCKQSNWKYYYNRQCESTSTGCNTTPSTPGDGDSDGDDDGGDNDGGSSGGDGTIADVNSGSCASILTAFCTEDGTVDIGGLLSMIITILTGTVVVAGTVGVIICGFLWMTARDNEGQVAQAKKRMLDIVIGIIAWVLLALLANLFIPRTTDDIESNVAGNTGIDAIKPVKTEPTTPQTPSGDNNSSNNSNNNGSNPATNNSTTPVKPLNKDSSGIACAAGTTDLGTTTEAYNQGTRITIRLCSIPTIKQSSDVGDGHNDGHIHVNSRVSGAYYALGKKYQDTHNGASLSATQSFRTMAKQQYFWDCYQQRLNGVSKPCNNGNNAARPGYSNHQLGTAVDFEMNGSGWSNTGVSGFFYQHLSTYGLDRPLTVQKVGDDDDECWHVAPK